MATASIARDLVVFVVLLALTTATLLLAFVLKGTPGLVVAYAIALVKGLIVSWEYMHLKGEGASSRLAMLAALAMVVLLVGLTAGDVAMRPELGIKPPPLPLPGAER